MRVWRAWVDACGRGEIGTSFALFRIALGATLAVDAARLLASGVVDPLFVPRSAGGLAPARRLHPLVEFLGGASAEVATGLWWGVLLGAAGVAVGFLPRASALVALQCRLALVSIPLNIWGGYDRLLHNGLWLVVLGGGAATLSVACRLQTGRWTSERPSLAFPRHLAVFQLVVLYTFTGWIKVGAAWRAPFEAVYRLMHQDAYRAAWDLAPTAAALGPLLGAAGVATLVFERTFPVFALAHLAHVGVLGERLRRGFATLRVRPLYLGFGVGLHVVLWVAFDVGTFSPATLAFYCCAVSPAEWGRVALVVRGSSPP